MRRFLLFAVLAVNTALTFATENEPVSEGANVVLKGRFVMANGIDENEKAVRYQALELNEPIDIASPDGNEKNIRFLKLWLQEMPPDTFSKNRGKELSVSGRVHYFSFGPSVFPNPAKFEVSAVKAAPNAARPKPSINTDAMR